ncbi:MAG: LysM domain-containing protein [Proteobacteria bacterium]|nr:LysM domain-containing protein [Pseudomonadota bacterium]
MGAVATRNNTTVDELVKINNLPNKDVTLQVGQKIKLP